MWTLVAPVRNQLSGHIGQRWYALCPLAPLTASLASATYLFQEIGPSLNAAGFLISMGHPRQVENGRNL